MANRQHFQLGSNAVLYHILVEHHFAKLHLVIAAPASSSQSRGHSHLCNPPGPAMEPEGSTLAHVFEIFLDYHHVNTYQVIHKNKSK